MATCKHQVVLSESSDVNNQGYYVIINMNFTHQMTSYIQKQHLRNSGADITDDIEDDPEDDIELFVSTSVI